MNGTESNWIKKWNYLGLIFQALYFSLSFLEISETLMLTEMFFKCFFRERCLGTHLLAVLHSP